MFVTGGGVAGRERLKKLERGGDSFIPQLFMEGQLHADTVQACLGIKGEQAGRGTSLSLAGVGAFTGQAGEDYSTQGLGELLEEEHVFL